MTAFARERQRYARLRRLPAVTQDGQAVELQANLELPIELPLIVQSGAVGIGLLRTEFMFMNRETIPDESVQTESYRAIIDAMHGDPAQRWTIEDLAGRAGMSRSTFALKFKQTVGASPMEYLTRWRMLLAGDKLVNSSDAISVIARSLGYESESAFSTAFKRVMGCSPRQYSRGRKPAGSSSVEGDGDRVDRIGLVAV